MTRIPYACSQTQPLKAGRPAGRPTDGDRDRRIQLGKSLLLPQSVVLRDTSVRSDGRTPNERRGRRYLYVTICTLVYLPGRGRVRAGEAVLRFGENIGNTFLQFRGLFNVTTNDQSWATAAHSSSDHPYNSFPGDSIMSEDEFETEAKRCPIVILSLS